MVMIKSHNPQVKSDIQTGACLYLWYGSYAVICFLEYQQTGWRFFIYEIQYTVQCKEQEIRFGNEI